MLPAGEGRPARGRAAACSGTPRPPFRGCLRLTGEGGSPGRGFVVDGSWDAPKSVPSSCRAGRRVTAEAAQGPGAGAKGACTGGKLAPPFHGGARHGRHGRLRLVSHPGLRERGEQGRDIQDRSCTSYIIHKIQAPGRQWGGVSCLKVAAGLFLQQTSSLDLINTNIMCM